MEKNCRAGQATDGTAGIVQSVGFVCWVPKAKNTNSECVIFIAFPLQQGCRKLASVLLLYLHCWFCVSFYWNLVAQLNN